MLIKEEHENEMLKMESKTMPHINQLTTKTRSRFARCEGDDHTTKSGCAMASDHIAL